MRLIPTSYIEQITKLPKIGRYILTQFNEKGVILYHISFCHPIAEIAKIPRNPTFLEKVGFLNPTSQLNALDRGDRHR
jgi:hypothetical protein